MNKSTEFPTCPYHETVTDRAGQRVVNIKYLIWQQGFQQGIRAGIITRQILSEKGAVENTLKHTSVNR